MVRGSNVAACHISSWLIAVLGMKLLPTSQPVESAHARARSLVQTPRTCAAAAARVTPYATGSAHRDAKWWMENWDGWESRGNVAFRGRGRSAGDTRVPPCP